MFSLSRHRRPQATDIHLVTQTLPISRHSTRPGPGVPRLLISPATHVAPNQDQPERERPSVETRSVADNLSVSYATDTEGGGRTPIEFEKDYPDWKDVKGAIAGAGLGLQLGPAELQASDFEDGHVADDDAELEDVLKDINATKKKKTLYLRRVRQKSRPLGKSPQPSHVSQVSRVSNNGSTSDALLRRTTGKDTEEMDDDKPLREGPSEAKFARDGFCTCSRFCRLTKADFALLAEVETAVQQNWDIPFQRMNHVRELVKKVGQHPRYKLTAKYWLATSTPLMSWMTLALRRREKNRSDNTFFYTIFKEKMQKSLLELIDQLILRYEDNYKDEPQARKAKLKKLKNDIHLLSKKQKRPRHVEAGLSFGAPAATTLDLPFGPEDWPLSKGLQMTLPLLTQQSTISDNTNSQFLGPPSTDGQASTSAAGAARSQNSGLTIDAEAAETGSVSAWANDDSRPRELFILPGSNNGASKTNGASTTVVPTVEEADKDNVENIEQSLCPPQPKSVFIVVGWFPSELHEPIEIYVRVDNLEHFLPDLKMHIMALRGWRSLFSFKSVQGFGLYKCHTSHFTHTTRHLSRDERVTLAHFFDATNASYLRASPRKPPIARTEDGAFFAQTRHWIQRARKKRRYAQDRKREDSRQWACWVHETMNLGKDCPFESQLSLKLLLNWSQGRIITAASVPLLLSFSVGLGFMLTHDGVESIATAWT